MTKRNIMIAIVMFVILAGNSYGQDASDQSNQPQDQASGGDHHAPSQAAIDACSGKNEGDSCDYTNSRGEDKSGTCTNTSDGQTLFCKRSKNPSA